MPAGVLEFRRRRSEEERSEVKGVMGEVDVLFCCFVVMEVIGRIFVGG